MALDFCAHEDVVFDDAPLLVVLTQVKFPAILSLASAAGVAGFQAGLRAQYPVLLPPAKQGRSPESQEGGLADGASPAWRFVDESKSWTVGLTTDAISLETTKYNDIDDFLARFDEILEVLRRVIRPAESIRVGLRKINRFEVPGRDSAPLSGMIRPELLGLLGVESFPAPLAGMGTMTGFQDEENSLVVRCGLADPEGEEVTRFVLDMDYYTERPFQLGGDPSMAALLKYFSDGMTSFFHWSLSDAFKETLRPHPRAKRQEDG